MSEIGRPIKKGVDWFSHDVNASEGRTLFTLESLYKNDGYAFWFKLLELLGQQASLSYEFKTRADWLYVAAKMKMNELQVEEILNTLSDIEAIDQELWKHKIVWSQNFVDRLGSLYKKRTQTLPNKPKIEKCEPDVITSKTAKSKSSDLSERKDDLSERKMQFSERELDNNSISTISTKVDITPYSPPLGDDGVFVTNDQKKQRCENLTVKTADGTGTDKPVNHSKTSAESDFDRFWETYPKKVGKKNARSAWKRLKVKPPLFEQIISALERQKKSEQWLKDGGRFIPNPTTWLNGERWDDEIQEPNPRQVFKRDNRDNFAFEGEPEDGVNLDFSFRMPQLEGQT